MSLMFDHLAKTCETQTLLEPIYINLKRKWIVTAFILTTDVEQEKAIFRGLWFKFLALIVHIKTLR